ncbi:MAG: winged helix-turn-helix transcriptional regulator [Cellvibrionaceae bacterium]
MRWDDINTQVCSMARTLAIVGDRWTFLIIRDLFLGNRRFSSLHKSLGLSKHRLSDRLNRLVENDVLYKQCYDPARQRFEYRLTEKGLDLYPVLMTIVQFGNKWEVDSDGIPLEHYHKSCGQITQPYLACSECDEAIHAQDVEPALGPGITKKIARGESIGIDSEFFSRAGSQSPGSSAK